MQILENFEKMTDTYTRGHHYTRSLILRPISAAHPWIDLCTTNPPGFIHLTLNGLYKVLCLVLMHEVGSLSTSSSK